MWEHAEATGTVDFVPMREEITAHYAPGESTEVTMHDGSVLHLRKLDENLDPFDRYSAMTAMDRFRNEGKVMTGLIYLDPEGLSLHKRLNTVDVPLNSLTEADLCPGSRKLEEINKSYR